MDQIIRPTIKPFECLADNHTADRAYWGVLNPAVSLGCYVTNLAHRSESKIVPDWLASPFLAKRGCNLATCLIATLLVVQIV